MMKIMLLTLWSYVVFVTDSVCYFEVTFTREVCLFEVMITRGLTKNIKKFQVLYDGGSSDVVKLFKCPIEVFRRLDKG